MQLETYFFHVISDIGHKPGFIHESTKCLIHGGYFDITVNLPPVGLAFPVKGEVGIQGTYIAAPEGADAVNHLI